MEGDYIKLNRKILEWEWYSDINTCRLFLHFLLKANWKAGKFQGTTVPRGSFVSSIRHLSEETMLTEREIRTAITHLKSTGEVTSESHSKYSLFTVVRYDLYQTNDTQIDRQETSERQTNDKRTTTIEEGKKERKEEGKNKKKKDTTVSQEKSYYPNDDLLNKALLDFLTFRAEIKAPMTDHAIDLLMKKLSVYDSDTAIAMLEQSILNRWKGIFPLKENGKQKQPGSFNDDMRRWADQYDSTGVYNNRNGD